MKRLTVWRNICISPFNLDSAHAYLEELAAKEIADLIRNRFGEQK